MAQCSGCVQYHKEINELKDFFSRRFVLLNRRFDDQEKRFRAQNRQINELRSYIHQRQSSLLSPKRRRTDNEDEDSNNNSTEIKNFAQEIPPNFAFRDYRRQLGKQLSKLQEEMKNADAAVGDRRFVADLKQRDANWSIGKFFIEDAVVSLDKSLLAKSTVGQISPPVDKPVRRPDAPLTSCDGFDENDAESRYGHENVQFDDNQQKTENAIVQRSFSVGVCWPNLHTMVNDITNESPQQLQPLTTFPKTQEQCLTESQSQFLKSPASSKVSRKRNLHNALKRLSTVRRANLSGSPLKVSSLTTKDSIADSSVFSSGTKDPVANSVFSSANDNNVALRPASIASFANSSCCSMQSVDGANENEKHTLSLFETCYENWGDLLTFQRRKVVNFMVRNGSGFNFRYLSKSRATPQLNQKLSYPVIEAFLAKLESYGFGWIEKNGATKSPWLFHKKPYGEMSSDAREKFHFLNIDLDAYEQTFNFGLFYY